MEIVLFDDDRWEDLQPLTSTRPVGELRCGVLTLKEKWEALGVKVNGYLTKEYLMPKYGIQVDGEILYVNSGLLASIELVDFLRVEVQSNVLITFQGVWIAVKTQFDFEHFSTESAIKVIELPISPQMIGSFYDLLNFNADQIARDITILTKNRKSAELSQTNRVIGQNPVFLEDSSTVECCNFNTTNGPIYIGHGVEIMEGGNFRGPIAFCDNSLVKLAAKIYGPTTIGPGCRVGGEVKQSIMLKNSNKGHDGFLGDSILGEWCNLGADTNNSNLKNNYENVKLWSYKHKKFVDSGVQFFGLVMGDHSKSAINTMFNTGTVVGVSCNIFGNGFPRNFIPSYSWGGASGMIEYKLDKAFQTMEKVMSRRGVALTEADRHIFEYIYSNESK